MEDTNGTNPQMSGFLQSLSKSAVKEKEPVKAEAETAPKAETTPMPDTFELAEEPHEEQARLVGAEVSGTATESKVKVALKALRTMEQNIQNIIKLLESEGGEAVASMPAMEPADLGMVKHLELAGIAQVDGRVVEGVFDGTGMVGSDGKGYTVPPNYASKSKLVEGDMLKLTITPKGSFIYKQIGPIERNRVMATLGFDPTNGEYYAVEEDKRWNVLKASVTYFRGEPGDEVVLLVPKNAPSKWGAVENIIKKNPL